MEKAVIIIDGFDVGYIACDNGDVIGKRGKLLSNKPAKSGYVQIDVCYNGLVKKSLKVHRLVWSAFNGKIPEDEEINHIDGNKTNNFLSNLECVTHSRNMLHSFELNLQDNKGSKHPLTKLNDSDAIEIIRLLKQGYRQVDISKNFNISIYIIKDIRRNKTWKHLPR